MTGLALQLAAAAEGLVGTGFRLHGRDRLTGMDCVGVIVASLAAIGRKSVDPSGYALRNIDVGPFLSLFERAGFVEVFGESRPGDVVMVRPGPAQIHLLVVGTDGSFIHADASLRCVVRCPGPLLWPVERRWRLTEI